jgi:RNA polymerase sigma-70 factor (ECF subfamily)
MATLTPEDFEEQALAQMDLLYGLACRLCHDPVLAQDLVQEAYLKAFRARASFLAGASMRAWMVAILRNACYDHWRRSRWIDPRVRADEMARPDPRSVYGPPALADPALERALASLPEKQRLVLVLFYAEEWSYEEISQALSVPKGTLGVWLKRAKERLRSALQEER